MFEPIAENERVNIQPQSGLGDLINALPYIEYLVQKGCCVTVATNHPHALAPYGDIVKTVPVEFNGVIPIIKEGFEHYKYNRYHEKDTYGNLYFGVNHYSYEKFAALAEVRYRDEYCPDETTKKYVVFAPPRAAHRHKGKNHRFECAPDLAETIEFMKEFICPVILVGKDDIYFEQIPSLYPPTFDLRDKTDFGELCSIIASAHIVVSQVSAITTIAGLFSRKTKFLKAAIETRIQHDLHVNGVKWPYQEVIE